MYDISREHAKKRKDSVWAQFLNLLNRPDTFIQNMAARYSRLIRIPMALGLLADPDLHGSAFLACLLDQNFTREGFSLKVFLSTLNCYIITQCPCSASLLLWEMPS